MGDMQKTLFIISKISYWSGVAAAYLVLPMFLLPVIESGVLRLIFNKATVWGVDITTYVFGASFMLGGAYCLAVKRHVPMDVIYHRCSRRTRLYLDIFSSLAILILCALITVYGAEWAWDSTIAGERTYDQWNGPLWPVKWFMPIGGVCLFLQALSDMIIAIRRLAGKEDFTK